MTFLLYLSVVLLLFVCLILIMLVLIQKGRGGGLASAFGGGAGGHTAFGSKTGDVLTWATSIVFAVFLLLAVAANLIFSKVNENRGKRPTAAAVGTTATTPGPAQQTTPAPAPEGTDKPVAPGQPGSSLPKAPLTADPGVSNPPPAPTTQP